MYTVGGPGAQKTNSGLRESGQAHREGEIPMQRIHTALLPLVVFLIVIGELTPHAFAQGQGSAFLRVCNRGAAAVEVVVAYNRLGLQDLNRGSLKGHWEITGTPSSLADATTYTAIRNIGMSSSALDSRTRRGSLFPESFPIFRIGVSSRAAGLNWLPASQRKKCWVAPIRRSA
jgi:hypothetical protein